MSFHDDEIIGKAYDARLMRRLLTYLGPYRRQVAIALVAIVAGSGAALAQPYLIKLAIDGYIAQGRSGELNRLAILYLGILLVSFAAEYLQTWAMQLTGQRIMFDLRMEIYRHLQRLDLRYYDHNPVGRLMTRVTSDVDVLNDLFTSGVVTIFSDVFTLLGIMVVMLWMDWRLALVAFTVLPLIVSHRAMVPARCPRVMPHRRTWITRINAFLQENITGMSTVQLFRREALNFEQFDGIDQAPGRERRFDLLLRGVSIGDRSRQRARRGADHLYGGANVLAGRSRSALSSRSCNTRSASSGRSATCRRSSTCCSRPWPPPSASSSCSTSRCDRVADTRSAASPGRGHIVFDRVCVFAYNTGAEGRRGGEGAGEAGQRRTGMGS